MTLLRRAYYSGVHQSTNHVSTGSYPSQGVNDEPKSHSAVTKRLSHHNSTQG